MEKVSDSVDIIKGKKKEKRDSEIEEELKRLKTIPSSKSGSKGKMENQHLKSII